MTILQTSLLKRQTAKTESSDQNNQMSEKALPEGRAF